MKYNIRVYGILISPENEILISDEVYQKVYFTKFPGGGHQLGESLEDTLIREFDEEMGVEITIKSHFYVNSDLIFSAFNQSEQLLAHYFLVNCENISKIKSALVPFDFDKDATKDQSFRWVSLQEINENDFTFPLDKRVLNLLKQGF